MAMGMVDSLFEALRDTLIEGDRVEIRGFGVLEVKDTKPKPGARNPRTGETVYVPAGARLTLSRGSNSRKPSTPKE